MLAVVVVLLGAAAVFAGLGPTGLWPLGNAAPEPVGFRGEIDGTVRSIDADAGIVMVARGMLDFSWTPIAITRDTRVDVDGKIGAFGDLREGLTLSVCYDVQPSGRWARAVVMPSSPSPCRAVADSAPSEPSRDEAVPPVALPVEPPSPQPPPAPAPTLSAAPQWAPAPTPPRPVILERPAPAPAPVATRASSPLPKARPQDVAPPPARTRPAERLATSGEDYGAVIDWVLKQ